jgi:RimJ/RimL family protein N-acetyltransferase
MNPKMFAFDYNRDFGEVFRLFTDNEVNNVIIDYPSYCDMLSFEKWFNDMLTTKKIYNFHVFWLDRSFVGFTYSYDFKILDGHTAVTVALSKEYQNTGMGVFIISHFLKFLFDQYPLRKVYLRTYSYNKRSVDALHSFGLHEESILKEYHYFKGSYHDVLVYALSRDKFESELTNKLSIIFKEEHEK